MTRYEPLMRYTCLNSIAATKFQFLRRCLEAVVMFGRGGLVTFYLFCCYLRLAYALHLIEGRKENESFAGSGRYGTGAMYISYRLRLRGLVRRVVASRLVSALLCESRRGGVVLCCWYVKNDDARVGPAW